MEKDSKIFGLLGHPLGHSISPLIHTYAYDLCNYGASYKLFDVSEDEFEDTLQKIKDQNIKGVNVTIPYKEKILKYLDYVDGDALKIGAVNTVLNDDGVLKGYNTDWIGFKKSLTENKIDCAGRDVFVIGAGGAAKAVVYSLITMNCRVSVFVRDIVKANALKNYFKNISDLNAYNLSEINRYMNVACPIMIVNCTPVGMKGFEGVLSIEKGCIINNVRFFYDLIYNPPETEFLKLGRECGCGTVNGIDMLLIQAIEAIHIWTGKEIDFKILKNFMVNAGFHD